MSQFFIKRRFGWIKNLHYQNCIKNVQDAKENKITIFVNSSKTTVDKNDDEPITNKEGRDK
ncbi:hypothetical protein CFT12S00416_07410 [Campylobacter fetus subsp. testudinum]|uniref:Uncharacterized protein n=1 Tax=Campylobacter fetus subsp. testudinum TaxID=1507806 RepID=A0AAX0HBE0_CAMFE|nr:hypothetical protein [Campylobacter fetus]OCR87978.1 hypothetical protein CFT12S00416_07410 [Campylobacter fetus subsp. testudinum]OCR90651.1 hypothetical protein CFT12S02225_06405 [Campylobacter fetus subsp. testudinum]OCR99418.1 hypothetical protein A9K75_07140 [Campylobacter fetus subsp. testudinum]